MQISAIVGGYGELEAVPILIRRIAELIDPGLVPDVLHPIRVPESRLRKIGELERAVELAALKMGGQGGLLVLLDCDWENGCPAIDGPDLLNRATRARSDIPISVVLAKQEYEAWFIAGVESLRGCRGLSNDITSPPDPESIRGAKEWLNERMLGRCYSETTDQPAFTARFDFAKARRADSFDKCFREIKKLIMRARL